MGALKDKFKINLEKISYVPDPVEASKAMISSVQRLVGVINVFGDNKRSFTIFSLLTSVIFGGIFVYVGTFSQIVYLFQVLPDQLESFKAINCISATCVPLSKFFFMWFSSVRLKEIFQLSHYGLNSIPEGSAAKTKMLSTLQRGRYASWLIIANQCFTHIFYLLMPLIFTIIGTERYLPTTPGETFGLSPKYETPFYEITFVVTTVGTAFSAINQTGYIVLFVTLLSHELGHFYAITQTLNDIYKILEKNYSKSNEEETENESVDEMLTFCVKHHQFLMQYHNKIRKMYKMVFGAHFMMMTIVLVTTLQTMNEWDIRNTILTGVTATMPLFLYCFGGELLISAGMEMSTAVYTCGWELMEPKQAKIVLLMLCLSQRPLYLTAADVFIMNRETFGDVAQVIYKIYAVFN